MRHYYTLSIFLTVLTLWTACGGASGFDADESRTRSISGHGFDSRHLHPVGGEAAGETPTYASVPSPPTTTQGVGPSLPRCQPTDGHGEPPVPRSVRPSYRAGACTNLHPLVVKPDEVDRFVPTTTTPPDMFVVVGYLDLLGDRVVMAKPSQPPQFTLEMMVDYFFDEADREWALRVAFCESSALPDDTRSYARHRSSGASGWFQHLPKFWEERTVAAGIPGADIMDPVANVTVAAYLLYQTPQGKGHWYPSEHCWKGR